MSRYIDADALIQDFNEAEFVYDGDEDGHYPHDVTDLMRYILCGIVNDTPTIDAVEVVHGEWIYDANGYDYGLPAWKCNQCGCINANIPPRIMTKESKPNYAPVNPNAFSGSNFCPNCGAKMDGEREDK